jgi:aspartate/tyrosine/aromatic aminotransferase
MRAFRSESLWVEAATKRFPERYRMTYFGILIDSLQIQIDQNLDGTARLKAQVHRRKRLIEEKQVRLSKRAFEDFKAVAEDSGLWTQYPEFWVLKDEDEICVDGMEALLERRDSRGYKFSHGNTSCTSPPGMGRLAEKMIALARLETRTKWLPWQQ